MPPVSYLTSLDHYMLTSISFLFASALVHSGILGIDNEETDGWFGCLHRSANGGPVIFRPFAAITCARRYPLLCAAAENFWRD